MSHLHTHNVTFLLVGSGMSPLFHICSMIISVCQQLVSANWRYMQTMYRLPVASHWLRERQWKPPAEWYLHAKFRDIRQRIL